MKRLTEKEPYWLNEEIDRVYKKLKEYEDLEEQGLLIRLPCKIGDTIYFIYKDCPSNFIEENCLDPEGSCENCSHRVPIILSRRFAVYDILKMDYIFTSREKAEAKLKKIGERVNEYTF